MKLLLVAGARPNFMKIAPIIRAMDESNRRKTRNRIRYKVVHTGQHYDYEMSDAFFQDLNIPKPDYSFKSGSGSHAEQTAKIMLAFEKVCIEEKPHLVVVVGDVNSTLACGIVAKKMGIGLAHVEAGLRSFDMGMPEEINRIVTDSITDYFFVTEKSAITNLKKEGKAREKIFFVGHVMVDNLFYQVERLELADESSFSTSAMKKDLGRYAFLTLHRPSNVDTVRTLSEITAALNEISIDTPILFPVHPRTAKNLKLFDIRMSDRIFPLPPLGYMESLYLWKDALLVLTDSGGLQEETTALGVPCITIRDNTERPITIEMGTNILAGTRRKGILAAYRRIIGGQTRSHTVPPKWDGRAGRRIVKNISRLPLTENRLYNAQRLMS
jgi:UDP-N-acetylglucosamine 2-epimerase (non-hydrolysing)